jgi:hypothetical protein
MSSPVTLIGDLSDELEDPGVVQSIQKHVSDGCPLAPLVEAVTPDYMPEERPRLIAAMVEKARTIIAHQNEHAANDHHDAQLSDTVQELPTAPKKRGRPKSEEVAARELAAKHANVSERTARRDLAKLTPAAEPIVPKPAKPKAIEDRLADLLPQLSEANGVLNEIRKSMDAAAQQFKWGKEDVRWRLLIDLGKANAQVSTAMMTVEETAERIRKARIDVFTDPKRELGDKVPTRVKAKDPDSRLAVAKAEYARQELLAREQDPDRTAGPTTPNGDLEDRIAKGGGLKAPKRVQVVDEQDRPLLPPAEETANAWADAAKVGVGPSDDGDNW